MFLCSNMRKGKNRNACRRLACSSCWCAVCGDRATSGASVNCCPQSFPVPRKSEVGRRARSEFLELIFLWPVKRGRSFVPASCAPIPLWGAAGAFSGSDWLDPPPVSCLSSAPAQGCVNIYRDKAFLGGPWSFPHRRGSLGSISHEHVTLEGGRGQRSSARGPVNRSKTMSRTTHVSHEHRDAARPLTRCREDWFL